MDSMMDPRLDLVMERVLGVEPALVWAAWTEARHLTGWFATPPWTTVECAIDLRPGGEFRTVVRAPDGARFPNEACYLELVPQRRLVWTDALESGFRPSRLPARMGFRYTVALELEPEGAGTRCRALVMHADEEGRANLERMDFQAGWGRGFDRLAELMAHVRHAARGDDHR